MSDLKPMSAADYRAHAQQRDSERPTEIVQLNSGSVFELRRPDLQAFFTTGRLPQSLVQVGLKAWKTSADQAAKTISDDDAADLFVFMREVVHDCTVNPKFVQYATNDNEISASDILKQDFDEIFAWAMTHKGVAGAESLHSFRAGQERRTTGTRPHGKKQRRKGKQPVETVGAIQ